MRKRACWEQGWNEPRSFRKKPAHLGFMFFWGGYLWVFNFSKDFFRILWDSFWDFDI